MVRSAGPRRGSSRVAGAVAAALALAGTGCGGTEEIARGGRPPEAITISAVITLRDVTVSPSRFGAGPVELVVSNQTSAPQRLELRSVRLAGGGPPLRRSTGPIEPGAPVSLEADLAQGAYVVAASGAAVAPATIAVGAPRADARERAGRP